MKKQPSIKDWSKEFDKKFDKYTFAECHELGISIYGSDKPKKELKQFIKSLLKQVVGELRLERRLMAKSDKIFYFTKLRWKGYNQAVDDLNKKLKEMGI